MSKDLPPFRGAGGQKIRVLTYSGGQKISVNIFIGQWGKKQDY